LLWGGRCQPTGSDTRTPQTKGILRGGNGVVLLRVVVLVLLITLHRFVPR
jgi:hypothetical protein